ncbi:MAG: hypothetical protein U5Q16_16395 [Gammaproteobacteria bacterium]|nr:hypothetical protein [Gammaproteobacteria bacterium]
MVLHHQRPAAAGILLACGQPARRIALLDDLAEEPKQFAVEEPAFETEQGGVRYRVEPPDRYRLQGLVVSRRAHDGDRMLHRRWNDHLNVADVCVVWGDAATADLSAFDFWSGQFTCFFRTDDGAACAPFVRISSPTAIRSPTGHTCASRSPAWPWAIRSG